MNDAKRFVVCFPLSAKLDYRFVVQVIRFFAVVHVVLCLRRKNIIAVVSLSCHTRHQIPTHQTQYTFIRNAFAFGYCFALFTRSTLDLFVCLFVLFPVIFIYLYVVSTQSSWWSARRGQRKPKQPKCRRENENKNNNLISFHGTFFSIVRLLFSALDALWSTSRLSLVLRASLCVAHCFFCCCCSLRFCNSFLHFLNWIVLNRFVCLAEAQCKMATFARTAFAADREECTPIHHRHWASPSFFFLLLINTIP